MIGMGLTIQLCWIGNKKVVGRKRGLLEVGWLPMLSKPGQSLHLRKRTCQLCAQEAIWSEVGIKERFSGGTKEGDEPAVNFQPLCLPFKKTLRIREEGEESTSTKERQFNSNQLWLWGSTRLFIISCVFLVTNSSICNHGGNCQCFWWVRAGRHPHLRRQFQTGGNATEVC